jgi:hypothetical protein
MEVEPTLDQEAGRATVLKTEYGVFLVAFGGSGLSQRVQNQGTMSSECALQARVGTQFGVKSGVKKQSVATE